MTRALPGERIELRLALVCYGGVSLAVYMHGVTKELHKLVQASRRFDDVVDLDEKNPFDEDDSARAYFEALREIAGRGRRLSVSIDVIAGTSAGGINGVVLGKVLACGGSQEKLKRLWIDEGDLKTLLRAPALGGVKVRAALAGLKLLGSQLFGNGEDKATSPLRGERMSKLLVDAIKDIDDTARDTLVPRTGSLDLFVTATDLEGFEMLVPTGVGGASQRDRQHAQVLRFSAGADDPGPFGPGAGTRALAFAARATSAFPGAFAPVGAGSFGTESGAPLDIPFLKERFVYPYEENGATAADAWFVDGGVLDNAPFDLVVRAIGEKRAESQVVRRIVYIEPDPGRPLVPRTSHGGGSSAPTWLAGLKKAALEVKGNHDVLRDLLALRDLNLHIAEVGSITKTQMSAVQQLLVEALPEKNGQASIPVTKDEFQQVSDDVHARATVRLGAGYPTYIRLKIEAAARRLADEVAHLFVYPPDARRSSFLRAAIGAWARGLDEWADPDPTRLIERLKPVDMPYRERRLLFLLVGINALYADGGTQPGAPARASLDALKGRTWDLLEQLRSVPGGVAARVDADFLSPAALDTEPFAAPEAFAAAHAEDFERLFRAYSEALTKELGDGSGVLWEAFQAQTGEWGDPYRRALLDRYLAFPFWDGLIFPTVALADLPQFTPIGVAQFSPLAAAALTPTEDGGKLKGVGLHHFAGFVESAWRQNDYLWGRLDGVELNLRTLYDAASADPAVASTAPPTREQALRTAGGKVLQQGLTAVLDAESDLTEITQTLGKLREQVAALKV
jgi:patatin-related protein